VRLRSVGSRSPFRFFSDPIDLQAGGLWHVRTKGLRAWIAKMLSALWVCEHVDAKGDN